MGLEEKDALELLDPQYGFLTNESPSPSPKQPVLSGLYPRNKCQADLSPEGLSRCLPLIPAPISFPGYSC